MKRQSEGMMERKETKKRRDSGKEGIESLKTVECIKKRWRNTVQRE